MSGKEGKGKDSRFRCFYIIITGIHDFGQDFKKRETFGPRVPPPTRGRWTHWAFSYFIFGVVIAHAKKKRYSHVSRLSATNCNRGPSDHSFFFCLCNDRLESWILLPPTFVSSCEISGAIVIERMRPEWKDWIERMRTRACFEKRRITRSLSIYIFFCRKIENIVII